MTSANVISRNGKLLCLWLGWALGFGQLPGAAENLLRNGRFESLAGWQPNAFLATTGRVERVPAEEGVRIVNSSFDQDATLAQRIAVTGGQWLKYRGALKEVWGELADATMVFVALDAAGSPISYLAGGQPSPEKPRYAGYSLFEGLIQVPKAATSLEVRLTPLGGAATFSDLSLVPAGPPAAAEAVRQQLSGEGFAVTVHPIAEPFWGLWVDDLDGDGQPEIIGCDTEGVLTVQSVGKKTLLTHDNGNLVYAVATADLDGDGRKEIIFSSLDPKLPVRALNLRGEIVLTLNESKGPQRIQAADMDGDGVPEIAVSVGNVTTRLGLDPVAGGLVLYDARGARQWELKRTLRDFRFGEVEAAPGVELVVGGPMTEFRSYDRSGKLLTENFLENTRLADFSLADIDGDGVKEIVAAVGLRESSRNKVMAIRGGKILWSNWVPRVFENKYNKIGVADFSATHPGLETLSVNAHALSLFDAGGNLIYQSLPEKNRPYWTSWLPGTISSLDFGIWDPAHPRLFLSSSRLRHRAYYELTPAARDTFASFVLPDEEQHLEEIYRAAQQLPAAGRSRAKVKVILANNDNMMQVPEATLVSWRAALDGLENENLEHLMMASASDLMGHHRGNKMTAEQMIARARLFEKHRIPFGFFIGHAGQPWTSEAAIAGCKQAAPTMFRFLYLAETTDKFYVGRYPDILKWMGKHLEFCANHGMQLILKDTHDAWGWLVADPEIRNLLFAPRYRDVCVPMWSTNEPDQQEVQLGGLLGLKDAGLCREFGFSTQYWNWYRWGRGVRDLYPYSACPADIILRLELMGVALGATWLHVEGSQTYLESDLTKGLAPMATRHRALVYELVRKNLLGAGELPTNLNAAVIERSMHAEVVAAKSRFERISYAWYERNRPALRQGFIPAQFHGETLGNEAFPKLAYGTRWQNESSFPQTPHGWVSLRPPGTRLSAAGTVIETDGDRVRLRGGEWHEATDAVGLLGDVFKQGAAAFPFEIPGTSCVIKALPGEATAFLAVVMDPGYLVARKIETRLVPKAKQVKRVTDLISGKELTLSPGAAGCAMEIAPGAFRLLRVETE